MTFKLVSLKRKSKANKSLVRLFFAILLTKIYNTLHYLHYSHYLQHSTILRFLSLLFTQDERKKKKKTGRNYLLIHLYFKYFRILHIRSYLLTYLLLNYQLFYFDFIILSTFYLDRHFGCDKCQLLDVFICVIFFFFSVLVLFGNGKTFMSRKI